MGSILRAALGPALIGLGAWAAASVIAPAAPETTALRFGTPASPLWALAAMCVALLSPTLRRHPALATPAALPVLPWLPVPLPAAAFVWTGRLAWFPVLLPFLAAWLAREWRSDRFEATDRGPGLGPVWAGLAGLALLVSTAASLGSVLPGGDEPHYLVITQSLLLDGDLAIANNHERRDYAAYQSFDIPPHNIRLGRDRQMYSIHSPGLPVFVAPGFAVWGYRGAQATVILAAAAAASAIWWIGWAATRSRAAAWFAWTAVVASSTFLVQGVTIFPDGPGAFLVAAVVTLMGHIVVGGRPMGWRIGTVAVALGSLPFLHSRFASLAGLLGLLVVWTIVRGSAPKAGRWVAIAGFGAIGAVAAAFWFGYFWTLYGSLDPRAPYGLFDEFQPRFIPGGTLGLFFDQQFGLLAYSPVLIGAVFGIWSTAAGRARALLAIVPVYVALSTVYWMWWAGGPAPPARIATAALPLFAAPLALTWHRASPVGRRLWATLLVVSVAITAVVLFAGQDRLFANFRTGRAMWLDWLGAVVDLPRFWPSFFWRLDPANLWTERAFAAHILVWLVGLLGAAVLVTLRARRAPALVACALGAIWWLPLGLTLAGRTTAALDASPPIRAIVSQLDVLSRTARGEPVFEVAAGRLRRVATEQVDFRMTVPRVELPGSPRAAWLTLARFPSGRYELRLRSRRPRGGSLTLRPWPTGDPVATFELAPRSVHAFSFELARDLEELRFEADAVLAESGDTIELLTRRPGVTAGP